MHGLTPMSIFRTPPAAAAALMFAAIAASPVHAQAPGLGASVELVDPKVLRVCADPNNLPFSNEKGEGFENRIAELLGQKLGKPVSYTWFPQVIGFIRNTLGSYRCDLIMGVPQGYDLAQSTNAYYATAYALLFKPGTGLDGIETLEDPRLKDKRIGIVAGTPPATLMVQDGLMEKAHPYPLTIDTRRDSSSKAMIDDLLSGEIDAGVMWGPMAGYYAKKAGAKLAVAPLLKETGNPPMTFRIAMGVRQSDQTWKRSLNRLIAQNQDSINRILLDYGVPLLDPQGNAITQ